MNYTEKVNQQIKAIFSRFEQDILSEVKKLVLESFQNGIDVGKQRQSKKKSAKDKSKDK